MQQAATALLYAALVLLALWVIRDFLPAVGWACVIALLLTALLRKAPLNYGELAFGPREPGAPHT